MSSALVGYLALGTVDPVSRAFTEATVAGYIRQPVAFDLDKPTSGGAVETGGAILRNVNTITFPVPTALDWPNLNAYALFTAATGGVAQIVVPLGARAGVHARGATRPFAIGRLVLEARSGGLVSPLGGQVAVAAVPAIVAGVLQLGTTALGGLLPGMGALAIAGAPSQAVLNKFYSFLPVVTGGYGPQSFALTGTLPDGLSFSPSTGAITGTPTTVVTKTGLSITVADDSGSATLASFSIAVAATASTWILASGAWSDAGQWSDTASLAA